MTQALIDKIETLLVWYDHGAAGAPAMVRKDDVLRAISNHTPAPADRERVDTTALWKLHKTQYKTNISHYEFDKICHKAITAIAALTGRG